MAFMEEVSLANDEYLRIGFTNAPMTLNHTLIPAQSKVFIHGWNKKPRGAQQCWVVDQGWSFSNMIPTSCLHKVVRWKQDYEVDTGSSALPLSSNLQPWLNEPDLPQVRKVIRELFGTLEQKREAMVEIGVTEGIMLEFTDIIALEQDYWNGIVVEARNYLTNTINMNWKDFFACLPTGVVDTKDEELQKIFTQRGSLLYIRGYDEIAQYPGSTANLLDRVEMHQQMFENSNLGREHLKAATQAHTCYWKMFWFNETVDSAKLKIFEQLTIMLFQSYHYRSIIGCLMSGSSTIMGTQSMWFYKEAKNVCNELNWTLKTPNGISVSSPMCEGVGKTPWYLQSDESSMIFQRSKPIVAQFAYETACIHLFKEGKIHVQVSATQEEYLNGFRAGNLIWPVVQFMNNGHGKFREHHTPLARLPRFCIGMEDYNTQNSVGLWLQWEFEGRWHRSWHQFTTMKFADFLWAEDETLQLPVNYISTRIISEVLQKPEYEAWSDFNIPNTGDLKRLQDKVPIYKIEMFWHQRSIRVSKVKGSLVRKEDLPRPVPLVENAALLAQSFPDLVHGQSPEGVETWIMKNRYNKNCARCLFASVGFRDRDLQNPESVLERARKYEFRSSGGCKVENGVCRISERWNTPPIYLKDESSLTLTNSNGRTLLECIGLLPIRGQVEHYNDPGMLRSTPDQPLTDDEIDTLVQDEIEDMLSILNVYEQSQLWYMEASWKSADGSITTRQTPLGKLQEQEHKVSVLYWFQANLSAHRPIWIERWVEGKIHLIG